MNTENQLYRDLQVHLDTQTLGFPETESGSDIRLLKELFTPEQAEVTMMLTYRYESLEQIYERSKKDGRSIQEINRLLHETAAKGVIGYRKKDGVEQYRNIPYVVGMLEGAVQDPTPGLISAHIEYATDGLFWKAFLNTKVPQMRTIPISKSITPEHHVATYDEIKNIIQMTTDPIAVIECVCRESAGASGNPCQQTSRKETCMVFRDSARNLIESGRKCREISKDEALEIMRKNAEDGLVYQPSNAQGPDFICSCCGCCCGILKLHKAAPNPVGFWATNFHAEVNSELCTACGTCEERCQTNAMKLDDEKGVSVVDLTRCLGYGLCVESCPEDAITLKKKEREVIPPNTGEEMMEVIMANKA
jgi:electron transport complex protein RnfB